MEVPPRMEGSSRTVVYGVWMVGWATFTFSSLRDPILTAEFLSWTRYGFSYCVRPFYDLSNKNSNAEILDEYCDTFWPQEIKKVTLLMLLQVNELAQKFPGLMSLRSVDLSPASWMAVAWWVFFFLLSSYFDYRTRLSVDRGHHTEDF